MPTYNYYACVNGEGLGSKAMTRWILPLTQLYVVHKSKQIHWTGPCTLMRAKCKVQNLWQKTADKPETLFLPLPSRLKLHRSPHQSTLVVWYLRRTGPQGTKGICVGLLSVKLQHVLVSYMYKTTIVHTQAKCTWCISTIKVPSYHSNQYTFIHMHMWQNTVVMSFPFSSILKSI